MTKLATIVEPEQPVPVTPTPTVIEERKSNKYTGDIYKELYLLTYMFQNAAVRFKLIRFSTTGEMEDMVNSAKRLCGKMNWRFLWLESAVEFLEID